MDKRIIALFGLCLSLLMYSQENKRALVNGNQFLNDSLSTKALEEYAKVSPTSEWRTQADYNSGLAAAAQDSLKMASDFFQTYVQSEKDPEKLAQGYHNLGNAQLAQQQLEESVKSYKEALKRNPSDEETRYNLAYAKKLLEKQQQEQKQNQDQKQNEDKKEEEKKDEQKKQNQEQNEEKKEEQDDQLQQNQQDQKEEEQQQEQQQQQQQRKSADRKQAEQMLNALNQAEKGVQKKVKRHKGKGQKIDIEKDW